MKDVSGPNREDPMPDEEKKPVDDPKDVELAALRAELGASDTQLARLRDRLDEMEEHALERYSGYEAECSMLRMEVLRLRRQRRKLLGRPKKGD